MESARFGTGKGSFGTSPHSSAHMDPVQPTPARGAPDGSCSKMENGLVRRDPSEQIVVGEIRQNLDDLKAAILRYYSRLYSQTGRSIEERLDRLAAPPFSHTVKPGSLPLAVNARSRQKRQPAVAVPPPDTCFDFLKEESRVSGQTDLRSPKVSDDNRRQSDPELLKTFYGIAQLPGGRPDPRTRGYDNFLGRRLGETHGGQIGDLLSDLRAKCAAASTRLNTIGDQLERECEDPNLREWVFRSYPEVRRHPNLGRDPQLRRHLLTIYQDLAHQSQTNQLKINAIQSKLKVLNLHTKADMIKLKSDPRIAF